MSHFIRWIVQHDPSENYDLFTGLVNLSEEEDSDIFYLFYSLKQADKMKALKMMQDGIRKYNGEILNKIGFKYPSILNAVIIPILEHLILPAVVVKGAQYNLEGNLSSTLSFISLEIYGEVLKKGGESLQKKELKRIISKLKFDDSQKKKNILVIKMIGEIIESINLPKST